MKPSFTIDSAGAALSEIERQVLQRLLAAGKLTAAQAESALELHARSHMPLLAVLGALGYVRQRDYAVEVARITGAPYLSELFETSALDFDPSFVRQFVPGELVRGLFCPLRRLEDLVIVLAVDPADQRIAAAIQQVVPGAELVVMVGTEIDVTRLVDRVFGQEQTFKAVYELSIRRPQESAAQVFTLGQIIVLGLLTLAVLIGLIWQFWFTAKVLIVATNLFYSGSVLYKLLLSIAGSIEEQAPAHSPLADVNDAELPIYSILVPVYKEPKVIPTLLRALSRMNYPREKLDVLLLMEATDSETIASAKAAHPPSFFRFILVPDSQPRTKPKACNYGLSFCRGEYVTIFDAEDIPEPDQLKKAVLAFRNGSESLVCVQAALNYYNSDENYLTRMFTLEYSYWFDYMLPGLDRLKLPIPLGGTSNHFRIDRLRQLGAWDPFNVTEDADLGIRASVRGYTVGVINSTTYEEANKAPRNWIRQRSRWIKGYMQTWLVHNRHPLRLLRQIGWQNWLSYQFFIGGTALTFLVNPLMWILFLFWLLLQPLWLNNLFDGWLLYLAAFNFLIGNMLGIYLNMLAVFRRKLYRLTFYALSNPFYWLMHSVAAYMALWQLFTKPFYWEKTTHGLTTVKHQHLLDPEQALVG